MIPAVPYLQALNLGKDGLIQAMGISFSVSTLALAAGLWLNGSYGADAAGASLLMLLPALLGMGLGQWLRGRLSPRVFAVLHGEPGAAGHLPGFPGPGWREPFLGRARPLAKRSGCLRPDAPRRLPRASRGQAALVERTDGDRHLAPARQLLLHRLDLDARLIEGVPAQEQMPWRVLGLRGLDKGTRDLAGTRAAPG